jgi:quercetin dioxygenase-like cupin family protein
MADELDPTKVDPDHYKVEFEDERVRVLRVSYGAGEESVMHSHPQLVAVFLSDGEMKFEYPDGTSEDLSGKSGDVVALPPTTHRPANIGSDRFQGLIVELKG